MAFHLSCPITCNRICFCTLGFPGKLQGEKKRSEFLEAVVGVEEFLSDPWSFRVGGKATVQVPVPRILPAATTLIDGGDGVGGDAEELLSAQAKRAAMQRRAVAASLAAEDYARRFETGNLGDISGEAVRELGGEEQASSLIKVVCRICYSGEDEGSDRAMRMLPCKSCSKRYHRSCLKSWAEYRDLFYWSSWACPSCRICEVCRRTGDANKFMFCKRCDGPYHCYCQHPPHKNVSSGPFLCPKHTRCHSCGSTVSGSGLSTRWFLGYTCCDACGRLFMKGNYCPVCLKVYRDTEPTPMVCCDACERWVHCECDGISEEKYQQFQADGNLYYKCAACRGDCYQVRDINDAVQELWRRRDKADKDQIASLRAAAGFPSQEEIFSIYPYSDEEDNGPIMLKSDNAHYLKLSVKGLVDKATEDTKKNGKKSLKSLYSNKKFTKNKGYHVSLPGKMEEPCQNVEKILGEKSIENCLEVEGVEDLKLLRTEGPEFVLSPSNKKEKTYISLPGIRNPKFDEDVVVSREDRAHKVLKIRNTAKNASKSNTVKGTKLVIHLGGRNKNQLNSPRYDASSSAREQDFPAASGSEDSDRKKFIGKKHSAEVHDGLSQPDAGKGVKLVREHRVKNPKYRGWDSGLEKLENGRKEGEDLGSPVRNTTVVLGRTVEPVDEVTVSNDEVALRKHSKGTSVTLQCERPDNLPSQPVSSSVLKDSKPLLKLKFKNPYLEKQNSWCLQGEEEKGFVKGQRSKRKRSSPLMEKTPVGKNESEVHLHRNNSEDEVMDAKWIVKKLGKDAIGKRVELHQSSDNSWHKGVIINMIEGTSILTVSLDDGQLESVELGKQGLRFISQKQKRMKQFSGLS